MNTNPGMFEVHFRKAMQSSSAQYRESRQALAAMHDEAVAALDAKMASEDWRIRLHAQIIRGWGSSPDIYAQIHRIADGTEPSLEGEKDLSGKPSVDKAVAAIQGYGESYAPALLEIVYKEPDTLTSYAFSVCANTLVKWRHKAAVPVFREIAHSTTFNEDFRQFALWPLVALKADGLFADFTRIAEDEQAPAELRVAALASIGAIDDERGIAYLRQIFEHDQVAEHYRVAAAEGLGETGDAGVIDILVKPYATSLPEDLRASIIESLIALDLPRAVESLHHIRTIESDPGLLEIIDEELEDLDE